MAGSDFEPFKLEIERLYIHENKTLPHVMDYMASKYSLIKSPGQYNRQLKKWGFVKGRITADEWNWMANKQNKRKSNDKKESEFYVGGNQVRVPKLKKAKYRDAYVSSIARYSTAPSPKTPEGFFVCTPTSPGMDLTWNGPLPWLRFISFVRLKESRESPSPSSSLPIGSPHRSDTLTRIVNHELMSRLSTIIPWSKLGHPMDIHSSSQTSAALSILMPEEFRGQHNALATDLNGATNKGRERRALELFLLSNNIASQDPHKATKDNMRSDDERMMQMLGDYGWKDLAHVQTLLSTSEPTAEAIAEKVFAIALRLQHVDAVKMMLEVHRNLNTPLIESAPHGVLTPLQFTTKSHHERSEELVNLLISYGADVNHAGTEYPPLFYAIRKRDNRIIRALMLHGAIVTPSCLSIATHLQDIEVFAEIVNSSPSVNVNAITGWQSALAEAVKRRNVPIIEILIAKGANMDNMVSINFDGDIATTTILGLGAMSQSMDVVRALLRACYDINPNFVRMPYISPIVIAVREGSVEITQALLQAGVDIKLADKQGEMTLLERAAKDCSTASLVPLCKVLIAYGAQVDRPLSAQKYETSALLIVLARKSVSPEVVQLLINAGARVNDEYTKPPYTALGAAVEQGNEVMINRLFATGATFVGTKLEAIGSLRTAIYLQENGVLEGILRVSGPGILAAALLAKTTDLAQYLLEHNADHEERIENKAYFPYQQTPLEAATQAQDFTFVKRLLERGARVTDSVLGDAISKDPVILKYLLARFRGSAPTAVGAAVSCRASLQLLQLLQGTGLDPTGVPNLFQEYWDLDNFKLPLPESVLEIAVVLGTRETLQFLLQWAPWSPRLTGRALTIAIFLDLADLAEDILSFHPDLTQEITIKYPEGEGERQTYRPLEAAVNNQMIPVARELMKKVDVNYLGRGARRRTALQYAVEKGNMELINLLISTHKARIDGPPATDGGATALQIACLKGYIGITRRLLDLGADINEAPAKFNGRTALQGAAEHGRIDTLQMLLNEGALIVGEGEPQYRRAVELAERNGHQAAARLLRSWRDSVCLSSSTI